MLNIKDRILTWITSRTTCPACGHNDRTYLIACDCTCADEHCACRWERELHEARTRLAVAEAILLVLPEDSDPVVWDAAEQERLDATLALTEHKERKS